MSDQVFFTKENNLHKHVFSKKYADIFEQKMFKKTDSVCLTKDNYKLIFKRVFKNNFDTLLEQVGYNSLDSSTIALNLYSESLDRTIAGNKISNKRMAFILPLMLLFTVLNSVYPHTIFSPLLLFFNIANIINTFMLFFDIFENKSFKTNNAVDRTYDIFSNHVEKINEVDKYLSKINNLYFINLQKFSVYSNGKIFSESVVYFKFKNLNYILVYFVKMKQYNIIKIKECFHECLYRIKINNTTLDYQIYNFIPINIEDILPELDSKCRKSISFNLDLFNDENKNMDIFVKSCEKLFLCEVE